MDSDITEANGVWRPWPMGGDIVLMFDFGAILERVNW